MRQLTLAQLYQPAVDLARSPGFVVSEVSASGFKANLDKLLKAGPNGTRLLVPKAQGMNIQQMNLEAMRTHFRAPFQGEVVRNELLADNLKASSKMHYRRIYKFTPRSYSHHSPPPYIRGDRCWGHPILGKSVGF